MVGDQELLQAANIYLVFQTKEWDTEAIMKTEDLGSQFKDFSKL